MTAAADIKSAPGGAGGRGLRARLGAYSGRPGRSRSSSGWRSSPPSCRSSSRSRRSTPSRRPGSSVNGFTNAGVFVLLAIGLNIVVGLAGLLDLGYAAFFAIGAYTYAYAASPFTGLQIPFWPMLVIGALVAAIFGILLGAPTLRLRGDYLAIVTLGFGEIVPIVFLNADQFTNGTNGIGGIFQPSLRADQVHPHEPVAVLRGDGDPRHDRHDPLSIASWTHAWDAPGRRSGRTSSPRRATASTPSPPSSRLRARRVHRRPRGRLQRREAHPGEPGPVLLRRLVHRPRDGRARRHGEHLGRRGGGLRHLHDPERRAQTLNQFFDTTGPNLKDIDFIQFQFVLYGVALVLMMLLRPEGLFPSGRRQARAARPAGRVRGRSAGRVRRDRGERPVSARPSTSVPKGIRRQHRIIDTSRDRRPSASRSSSRRA